jgi:hypothetical protein
MTYQYLAIVQVRRLKAMAWRFVQGSIGLRYPTSLKKKKIKSREGSNASMAET